MKYLASKVHSVTVLTVLAVMLAVSAPTPGAAQDLAREIDRLKRDLADLQRFVYAGKEPPASSSGANVAESGTSTASQGLPSDVAGRMQVRFQQMEEQMRDLTGRLEEVQFSIRRTERRVEKLAEDVEFRLDQLEQRVSGGPLAQNPGAQNQGAQNQGARNNFAGQTDGSGTASSSSGGVQPAGDDFGETTVISSAGSEGPGAENAGGSNNNVLGTGSRSLGSLTLNETGVGGGGGNAAFRSTAAEYGGKFRFGGQCGFRRRGIAGRAKGAL